MPKVLVIDDDRWVCDVISECLQDWPDTEVDCAPDGRLGALKLRTWHFDLALIDGALPEISGLKLAEIAANENTPVLLLSGHPEVSEKLERFGYPYLAKPFSLDELLSASQHAIAEAEENIRGVKASAARSSASTGAAKAAMAESPRLVDRINMDKGPPP